MSQKTMYEAKCTSCGKTATVPFKPTAGKPVYCRECFSKSREVPKQVVAKNSPIVIGKEGWARRRDNGQTRKETETANAYSKFTQAP
jgi:CxxC-x17-CxxC domain-containing protein